MNKSKNIRSVFNQIINEEGPIIVKGGARRGVGRWRHVIDTPTPPHEQAVTQGMNMIHPDHATNIGRDLVNVGRAKVPFSIRQVHSPTEGGHGTNAYVPFLSAKHHQIIKDIHQKLISEKGNPHTEEYQNLLGNHVLNHPEFGHEAIEDAKAKYELDRDVGNYAVLGGSNHPVHAPILQGIMARHGSNPHFNDLVAMHRTLGADEVTNRIKDGKYHVPQQDKIVKKAVDALGGSLDNPQQVKAESNNLYRQGLRALFESVLDEMNEENNPSEPKPDPNKRVVHRKNKKLKYLSPEAREIYNNPLGFLAGNTQRRTGKTGDGPRQDSSHNIRKAFQSILSEAYDLPTEVARAGKGDANSLTVVNNHPDGPELLNAYREKHASETDRGTPWGEAHQIAAAHVYNLHRSKKKV